MVLVAMEDVLENFGEIFDNLFVDKEGQNFLVDVEEISGSSFLVSNKLEMFCLLLGRFLTNKGMLYCSRIDSFRNMFLLDLYNCGRIMQFGWNIVE